MSEPDIATKAPESDAQEPSGHSDAAAHTHAQTPAEHCVTDRPTPSGQSSTGEFTKLGGVDVYISKPNDYPHTPSRLLLLLTGGTGIKSTNNQIQADRFASEGFLVLMPDYLSGDTSASATIDAKPTSIIEQVKARVAETTKAFLIDMWLARITEEKILPVLHKVIDAANDHYADAAKFGGGIYAVGYCVGGRFVLLLGKETKVTGGDEETAERTVGPFIKAGAVAHAASVVPDDFKDIKVPLSLVCVEDDPLFPDEVRTNGEDIMSDANLEHEVSVYPGVPHGFAVVGEYQDQSIKDAQATAYEQMLKWVQDH